MNEVLKIILLKIFINDISINAHLIFKLNHTSTEYNARKRKEKKMTFKPEFQCA